MIQTKAHGKHILSGEHSVVHGCPAIAIPATAFTCTCLTITDDPSAPQLTVTYQGLATGMPLSPIAYATADSIWRLLAETEARHHANLSGERPIPPVLASPLDLIAVTVATFYHRFSVPMDAKIALSLTSTLPTGCGMGASAAAIMSVFRALCTLHSVSPDTDAAFDFCLQCENYQHGQSSGLDVMVSLLDAPIHYQQQRHELLTDIQTNALLKEIIWDNTGQPSSNTGDCVVVAKQHFTSSHTTAFTDTTEAILSAIRDLDRSALKAAVQKNHRLLCELGVVPVAVQQRVRKIETAGGAAKISGAGSVTGDAAGMLMIVP